MERGIGRRKLLMAGIAAPLAGCAQQYGGAVTWQNPVATPRREPKRRPIIDAHCHIFNGQDLAISGYTHSYVREQLGDHLGPGAAAVVSPVLKGAQLVYANASLFVGQEIDLLSVTPIGAPLHPIFYEQAGRQQPFGHLMSNSWANLASPQRRTPTGEVYRPAVISGDERPGDRHDGLQAVDDLVDFLPLVSKPRGSLALLLEAISTRRRTPEERPPVLLTPALVDMGNWVNGTSDPFSYLLSWLGRNVVDRANRAALEGLLGLTLRSATIKEQMAVMKVLSQRRPEGLLIHPFVPYDPWRGAVDLAAGRSDEALREVQDAILTQGAVGVKLYPPMGFRVGYNYWDPTYAQDDLYIGTQFPLDWPPEQRALPATAFRIEFRNAIAGATRNRTKPREKEPAYWLDKALCNLFAWCERFTYQGERSPVPVMAHTGSSHAGDGSNEYFERAHPAFWGPVLQSYPRLRINLGHFGGIWRLGKQDARDARAGYLAWPHVAMELIRRTPPTPEGLRRVYADMADVPLIGDPATNFSRNALLDAMQGLGQHNPLGENLFRSADFQEAMMYGSDFPFTALEGVVRDYARNFEQAFRARFEASGAHGTKADELVENVMCWNAARFLDLRKPGGKPSATLRRLTDFHAQALLTEATANPDNVQSEVDTLFDPFLAPEPPARPERGPRRRRA